MPSLNEKQKEALSAMMLEAVKNGAPEKLENCIRLGGEVARPVEGSPLLHHLAQRFDKKTAEIVLKNSATVDLRDNNGDTALIKAIRGLNFEAVDFFMNNGANPLAQNNAGEVALDVAREKKVEWPADITKKNNIIRSLLSDHGQSLKQEIVEKEAIKIGSPLVFKKKPRNPPGGFRI